MTTTLATLFRPGALVRELDDDDLSELAEILAEVYGDRGGTLTAELPRMRRDRANEPEAQEDEPEPVRYRCRCGEELTADELEQHPTGGKHSYADRIEKRSDGR